MPHQQLLPPGDTADDGRTVSRLRRAQRTPQLPAGQLVEGNANAPLAPDNTDQAVPANERVGRCTPFRDCEVVILLEIPLPNHRAVACGKAEQVALRTQRIQAGTIHGGSGAGTDRVCGHGRVRAVPVVRPKRLAVGLVEAKQTLPAGQQFADEIDVTGR